MMRVRRGDVPATRKALTGRRPSHPARQLGQISAGFGLLLVLALAGCAQVAPETPEERAPRVVITILAPSTSSVAEGSPLEFLVRADPAPSADLTVGVKITSSGCELRQAPKSVRVSAGKKSATLTVPTSGAGVAAECTVTATIAAGAGYRVGAATAASASATVMPKQPEVTIAATTPSVTEGEHVSFTLTVTPRPASALTVTLSWEQDGAFLTEDRPQTIIVPTTGTAKLTAETRDDSTDEPHGSVTVTVEAGSGYRVGSPGSATVTVRDNDPASPGGGSPGGGGGGGGGGGAPTPPPPSGPPVTVTISVSPTTIEEGQSVTFTVTATPAPTSALQVNVNPQSIHVNVGKLPRTIAISGGNTTGTVTITTIDDDDPPYSEKHKGKISLLITSGSGYVTGSPFEASATVTDRDT